MTALKKSRIAINRRLKRLLISICVSFYVVTFMTFRMVLQHENFTDFDRYVAYFFSPAAWVANELHLLRNPVLEIWGVTSGFLIFYGLVTWLVLSLWSRIRTGKI